MPPKCVGVSTYLLNVGKTHRRIRRHHVVPRFHLRGFADENQMLAQIDLETGYRTDVSIGDAALIKNFYTVELHDGTRSDEWEKRFAQVESIAAPLVRRLTHQGMWPMNPTERENLATWMALQFMRGPDHRRMCSQTAGFLMQMQVGMGGIAYLRHAMQQGLGRDVANSEAQTVWDDIHKPGGPEMYLTGNDFISSIRFSLPKVIDTLTARSWHRVRFERRTLAINDSPVALIPDPDAPEFRNTGLHYAAAITIALDRRTLLWLGNPGDPDFDMPPTTQMANLHNQSVVLGADRFVYTHPADPDPTLGLPVPRAARTMPEPHGLAGTSNPDRELSEVLAQIDNHPDRGNPDVMIADYAWPFPGYKAPPFSSEVA